MTHVLVTRPLEASRQLAELLDQSLARSIVMPLYTFSSFDPGQVAKKVFASTHNRHLVIFTSPRAVQYGLQHIPHDVRHTLEVAAMGSATSKTLEESGLTVDVQSSTGYTSEDLLAVPELNSDPGSATIFCAPGGRRELSRGLGAMGWTTNLAMVYQREPLPPAQDKIDAIMDAENLISVWTSISALDIAREYLPMAAWLKVLHSPALVISRRIQHHLQDLGATHVDLTDGAANKQLFRSIQAVLKI